MINAGGAVSWRRMAQPVPLSVGSSLMTAERGAQELVFSLRMPTNVSISAPGNDTITYYGECITAQ